MVILMRSQTDRNGEYVIGQWRKGGPCYDMAKTKQTNKKTWLKYVPLLVFCGKWNLQALKMDS